MSWRYRVMKHRTPLDNTYFTFHEVHDDPLGWTEHGAEPEASSVGGLRAVLSLMLLAFDEPVLDGETGLPVKEQSRDIRTGV